MNVINNMKELLAAAPLPHDDHKPPGVRCPGCNVTAAQKKVRREINRIATPIALALFESQEALASRVTLREHETSCDACWNGLECRSQAQLSDDNEKKETTALRLDGLVKAIKEK